MLRKSTGAQMVVWAMMAFVILGCSPKRIGPTGEDGKALTWDRMDFNQRKAHMQNVVLPQAAEVFRHWRPEKYVNVDCTLCHDGSLGYETFDMPTAHLIRLSGKVLLGPEFANYPDTTQLKLDRLVPTMATALGKKPFSIVTRRGFGCYSCHLGPQGPMFGN